MVRMLLAKPTSESEKESEHHWREASTETPSEDLKGKRQMWCRDLFQRRSKGAHHSLDQIEGVDHPQGHSEIHTILEVGAVIPHLVM
jgi:hypothetical protein